MSDKNKFSANEIEIDSDEAFEEGPETDLNEPMKNQRVKRSSRGRAELPFIIIGIIVVVSIGAVMLFMPKADKLDSENKMQALEERLGAIEKKLGDFDVFGERLSFIENQGGEADVSIENLEKRLARLSSKINKNQKQIAISGKTKKDKKIVKQHKPEKKTAVIVPKNVAKKPEKKGVKSVAKKSTVKKINKKKVTRYHIVKKGDTLYSISRKYSLPVAQLRKLNKLKDSGVIYLGQKIVVSPK